MRAIDSNRQSNIGAGSTAAFQLAGGTYHVSAIGTWGGGNLALEALGPDGTTYLPMITAISANGVAVVQLPQGQYRWTVTTATGVYARITRIPEE